MFENSRVVIVAAMGKNRELGNQNKLLWHMPEDLKRFRVLSSGHPMILGRKTFESILSILGKPLPHRANIVVSRDKKASDYDTAQHKDGFYVVGSLEEALTIAQKCDGSEEIHIGGGAQLYSQALPLVDTLHLTLVDDAPVADTYFPAFENDFEERGSTEEKQENAISYRWVSYTRKKRV